MELSCALGDYSHTEALKQGKVHSERITLDFKSYSPVNRAFKPMATDLAFDVSELAYVTYMLALDFGRPFVGVPITIMRQPVFPMLVTRKDSKISGPKDLEGLILGVRAYSQTSGAWVRGIIADQYDVDLSTLRWVTQEGAHVDEYVDPSSCRRDESGRSLLDLLLSGEVDAAIGIDGSNTNPDLRTVIPGADAAEAAWTAKTGIASVNHTVVVQRQVLDPNPWLRNELYSVLNESRALGVNAPPPANGQIGGKFGLNPNRVSIDTLARYAFEQQITRQLYSADELFPS
ncbi:MAG: hypothetical protein EXR58_03480 [Chloroflexi bacterium]|nr:hypothetical protein [Chloroflexota bacterium]